MTAKFYFDLKNNFVKNETDIYNIFKTFKTNQRWIAAVVDDLNDHVFSKKNRNDGRGKNTPKAIVRRSCVLNYK